MNTCLCGCPVEADGELCERCAALRVLELDADATEKEIRAAYHTLVKVWHPDRFEGDRALKEAAETRLKDVNSAYEFLTSICSDRDQWQQTRHRYREAVSQGPYATTESAAKWPPKGEVTAVESTTSGSFRWMIPTLKNLFKFGFVVFAILLGRYVWIAFDVPDPTSEQVARAYSYGKDGLLKGLETPKRRFVEAVERDLRRLDPRKSAPAPTALAQAAESAPSANPQTGQTAPAKGAGPKPAKIRAATREVYPFITVGSTMVEVLAQQGIPTASSENKLVYGRSELYFKDNAVIGWRIDPSSPIRVKFWPASPIDTSLDSFTYGSPKDVVLMVQGTPTAFSEDKFEYGGSEVDFRNNRVVQWKNGPGSIPLRARLN